ncbi:MAG: hypothetical protein H0T11_00005, partial [Chthoniobacterales bacterium]|nr:hypothetical protein [Chthoniobacterales bacterium]
LYLIQGAPGCGKTTLALQFLLTGAAAGERVLYISLSETREEVEEVARSHGWPLEGIEIVELSAIDQQLAAQSQNTLFHSSEVELNETTSMLLDAVDRVKPTRVAFDSLSELRLLSQTPLRYRRQILAFKQYFVGRNCTTLLLDDSTAETADAHVLSLAHGVLALEQLAPEYGGERRRLNVRKVRGTTYRRWQSRLRYRERRSHRLPAPDRGRASSAVCHGERSQRGQGTRCSAWRRVSSRHEHPVHRSARDRQVHAGVKVRARGRTRWRSILSTRVLGFYMHARLA